jgi:uncharacterized SAM-binding protein YcdF (DUF218 family)
MALPPLGFDMYRVINELLVPDRALIIILGAALAIIWWRQHSVRRQLAWVIVPYALFLLASMPAVAHLASVMFERPFPPITSRPDDAQCIVVLSGGALPRDDNRPHALLSSDTIYRCLHAAELYRSGNPVPVMVSGGILDPKKDMPALAYLMKDFLVQLNVQPADIIVEARATTTYENAVECRKLLDERRLDRIVLVTEVKHMYRASRCFTAQGLAVTPAPCQLQDRKLEWSLSMLLPNAQSAIRMQEAFHELLGLAWYKLKGRI